MKEIHKYNNIKITSCSFDTFWYNDRIGDIFEIVGYSLRDYYVMDGDRVKGILIKDVVLIKKSPLN
jgi:hypothetical protein